MTVAQRLLLRALVVGLVAGASVALVLALKAAGVAGAASPGSAVVDPGAAVAAAPARPRRDAPARPALVPPARAVPAPVSVADPVRVQVPRLDVDAPVGPLEVDADGALEAPEDYAATGWWRDGPEPGEPGPAVIAGHVDDWRGPAVFYRLRDVAPGDEVVVERRDGTTAVFEVVRTVRAPKDAFPTAQVYGPTAGPELRLITCGGDFDRRTKSYVDNLVVFARLTS